MVLKEACFVAEEDICAAPACKTLSQNKKIYISNLKLLSSTKKFEVKVKVNSWLRKSPFFTIESNHHVIVLQTW